MNLTVLGKYGPFAKSGNGATSCYLVEENDTKLLLDMGAGSLSRLLGYIDVKSLDAIFISHLHYDHTSDLLCFRYLLDELKIPITIITQRIDSEWYKILFDHPLFNVIDIDADTVIFLKDFTLSFFEMVHPVHNYAIKIEGAKTLVYTGDTTYNDNIYKAIDNADCVLADCSKPIGFSGPHMTVDKAIEIHNKTGVRILATHLSPDYSPETEFSQYDGIEVVKELTTYTI